MTVKNHCPELEADATNFKGLSTTKLAGTIYRAPATTSPTTVQGGTQLGLLLFAIFAYSCVSLTVVYFNWWLFTTGFKYPVFVSWIQQCVGVVMFYVGSQGARFFPSWRILFPATVFRTSVAMKVLPLSVSFVLTIGLSNICLQKTLISTYQVARSLTLLFVIILSYVLLKEKQTPLVLFSCSLMVVGFIIGSLDPTTLSLAGLLAGAFSSFFQSLYNVLIKKTLPYLDGDNQGLLNYNVILSSILFLPMTLISEDLNSFRQAIGADPDGPSMLVVWGGMVLSGILGTLLNMTQYLVVKVTSALTFNIIGFSKSLVQSAGGIVFLGDKTSWASGGGLLLCVTGSGLYVKAKNDVARKSAMGGDAKVEAIRLDFRTTDEDTEEEEGRKTIEISQTEEEIQNLKISSDHRA